MSLPVALTPETDSGELPMLDIYLPMMKSAAILSAGELGLFEALSAGPLSPETLASQLSVDLDGLTRLADFLLCLGYLEAESATPRGAGARLLRNAPQAQRWFTSAGSVDYRPGLRWTQAAWSMMTTLTQSIRQGGPETTLWAQMTAQPHLGEDFAAYMAAFARDLGPDLVQAVSLAPGVRRMLDLGGSHGLHSMRFCQHHPDLQAVIVDLPSALGETPARIAAAGLSERIECRPGALQGQDWGTDFDLVLYLSVAHNHQATENRDILARIAASLRPGGQVLIHEYIADQPAGNAFHAAFNLTLLYETGTRTHRRADYDAWLSEAGLVNVRYQALSPIEKGTLILAARP